MIQAELHPATMRWIAASIARSPVRVSDKQLEELVVTEAQTFLTILDLEINRLEQLDEHKDLL